MIILARRASAILYRILRTQAGPRPFLVPANVCPIVPRTFLAARVPFHLVDIEEQTLHIDPARCLDIIVRERGMLGGILFVRPYGSEGPAESFFRELKRLQEDLLIIDDKCLCRPDCDGAAIAAAADLTLFSTGPRKYADCGWGGFAHVREGLRWPREDEQYAAEGFSESWLDLRPPESSWDAYRTRVLQTLQAADEQKRQLNVVYESSLPSEIQMPPEFCTWRFNVRVPAPDRLIKTIFEQGLFASRHYPVLGPRKEDFPVAQHLADEVVNLFNDRYFDLDRAARTSDLVRAHVLGK